MRKRAQRKGKQSFEVSSRITYPTKPIEEKKRFTLNKKWWIAVSLISIFLMVLFLNTYFNLTSGIAINPNAEGFDKFYLSGPDPYYNLRLVKGTYETGVYPYYHTPDPILNYPIGSKGARAPLFNMMALGFSKLLTPFMNEIDAIGYSMQFIPALFGALIIFVVYFIGKELFSKKAGIIAALFIAIIPAHLGSGHGSAFGLFDHDSFNLLLFFLTFFFLIKSIKEKNSTKSSLYAILGGISLAGLSLVWVEAHYLYVVIAIYAGVQMLIDIYTSKIELKTFRTIALIIWTGYIVSLPVVAITPDGFVTNVTLFICILITLFGILYILFGRLKIPWTLSLPAIFSIGAIGLIVIYFAKNLASQFSFFTPLITISNKIFGIGIYGDKVSMTIAEANTSDISNTIMSFGPAIYWIGWAGLLFLCYKYYKNIQRRDYLLIIVIFLVDVWLAGVAGRFINDMVPIIAILAGWIIITLVEWIDYKKMVRDIKGAGGGLHGIRKGVKFLHIFGIIFIAFIVILPNAFVAFDAAVPNTTYAYKTDKNESISLKGLMFGSDYQGAYGMGIIKEKYWGNALNWLKNQDTSINNSIDKPAFISWWDYGFYEAALGEHPTVADNFQDGIDVAANFHTATSEKEAVSVWIIRLLNANSIFNNGLTNNIIELLTNYLGNENATKIAEWMKNPTSSPSYGSPIGAEYDKKTSKKYTVGQQYQFNAVYHDVTNLLDNLLDDEEITLLYHDLQKATGWSIRYYGVEGYDKQIFNIFAFLSDKSLLLVNGIADDFVRLTYSGYEVDPKTGEKVGGDKTWDATDVMNWSRVERATKAVTGTNQVYKDPYFETMFYRTYIGPSQGTSGSKTEYDYQLPCQNMKHFYAEYISDLSHYPYYDTGKSAVVISKYYEGALINGTVTFKGRPVNVNVVAVKNVTYTKGFTIPIEHDSFLINTTINKNGNFNVILGANASLQIRKPLGTGMFNMKNVTFEGPIGSNISPITDDDAMRKNGSYYERLVNITINPSSVEGYVFNDTNYDGVFNSSIDEPLSGLDLVLYEVLEISQNQLKLDTNNGTYLVTDENGYYNASGLLPGVYRVLVVRNNFIIYLSDIALYEGNNSYNLNGTRAAALKGIVYYDSNSDKNYNSGEELSNATVDLIFNQKKIRSFTAGPDGMFLFESLESGTVGDQDINPYTIKVIQKDGYEAQYDNIYPTENETTWYNVSMDLTPVKVTGKVTFDNNPIEGVSVTCGKNESIKIEDNTAVTNTSITDSNGVFTILLKPGYYNISGKKLQNQTIVYEVLGDTLKLDRGQGLVTKVLTLEKISSTVSGYTMFEGENIKNISILFKPINNTGTEASALSDEKGFYLVELATGNYTVNVIKEMNVSGELFNYTFTDKLNIPSNNSIIPEYNIIMAKEKRN